MSEIATEAGVSKASLFHYFNTKKELFIYLYRFVCEEILAEIQEGPDDFFACIRLGTQMKLRVMKKHPGLYDFLLSLIQKTDAAMIAELREINTGQIERGLAMLFANVDWSRFRDGLDRSMIINMVNWISEGYMKQITGDKTRDETVADLDRYLDIIKKALYKEAYL